MARPVSIAVPRTPKELLTLSADIQSKHASDDKASPLPPNVITELHTLSETASQQMELYKTLDVSRAQLVESIGLQVGTKSGQSSYTGKSLVFYISSARDILSGWYREAPQQLTAWGFEVAAAKGRSSKPLPKDTLGIIELATNILKKHKADGADSPLNSMDMADFDALTTSLAPTFKQLKQIRKEMEAATEARNLALGILKYQDSKTKGTVYYYVCSVRDILQGIFRGRERALGDWGFVVNAARSGKRKEEDANSMEEIKS